MNFIFILRFLSYKRKTHFIFLFRGSKSSALESKRRLAILRKDVASIVKHLMENAKSYHHLTLVEICRLKIRFNAKNVFEFKPSIWNGYDAYIKTSQKYIFRLYLGSLRKILRIKSFTRLPSWQILKDNIVIHIASFKIA